MATQTLASFRSADQRCNAVEFLDVDGKLFISVNGKHVNFPKTVHPIEDIIKILSIMEFDDALTWATAQVKGTSADLNIKRCSDYVNAMIDNLFQSPMVSMWFKFDVLRIINAIMTA